MFIVPLRAKGVDKRIPVAVILLIAINVLTFIWQFRDDEKVAAAFDFYEKSILYRIEPELYQRWLQKPEAAAPSRKKLRAITSPTLSAAERKLLASELIFDGQFLNVLESGRLIDERTADGIAWRHDRAEFLARLRNSAVFAGSFTPREHRLHTFVTASFLHSDSWHLLGNMVFLWLAGTLLESLIGSLRFLCVYFATDILATTLSWALSPDSALPELGASGAISGAMGALAASYGARKIPCLFSIGVLAWRGHMQGYWLAGVWVVWEVVQQVMWASSVNRAAHLGGLVAGAVIGDYLGRRADVLAKTTDVKVDRLVQLRDRARLQATDLKFEAATNTMLTVVEKTQHPDDWTLLWNYGRHVLDTPAGKVLADTLLTASSRHPDTRTTLLAIQSELRRRQGR